MERQLEWDLVIKVKHGDTLRRIGAYVHGQHMDLNMSKLKSKIISLFKITHDPELILTYTDEDGDIVTLDDDDELRDAVIGQRLNPLRINVQLKSLDRSSAGSERSANSNSANAPRPETLPTVGEGNKSIPEPLLGVVSNLVGIAQKAISSSPAFALKVDDVMKSEPFRSTLKTLSNDVKSATSFSPVLSQVVEQLSEMGLSNAGLTSGLSGEASHVPNGSSTHKMDLNATEEPKEPNVPIPETIDIPSDTTRSGNPIPREYGSVNTVVHGSGALASSVDLKMKASKNGKAPLYPIDDVLASNWTANNLSQHEKEGGSTNLDGKYGTPAVTDCPPASQALHGSGNFWTHPQEFPIPMDDLTDIMVGGSSKKQSPMKFDFCPPALAGFNSYAEVPVSGHFGPFPYEDFSMPSEFMKTHSRRRSHIINETMPRSFHRGVRCDGCGMHPIVGPRFKSNVKDDYDLCDICFSQMGNVSDYTKIDHSHHRAPRLLKPFHNHHAKVCFPPSNGIRGCGMRPHKAKLESRFIQDVTVLDGTVMPPSTHFTKIWRLRNNGNVPWPFRTQLVWLGGDQFGDRVSAELEIPPSGFPVDKELDIAVDFTAPSRPGRYVSYWKMASPSGQKFGQRVWVLIQVDYSPPISAAGSSFHPDLNLNLPPVSNGQNASVIIDVNAEPLDGGFPERDFNGTTELLVEPLLDDVQSDPVELPAAQVVGSLLDGSNDELVQPNPLATTVSSPSASFPFIDLQATPPSLADDSPPVAATAAEDGNTVEQTLLKELEEMGFKQIDLNKEVLRLNEYDFEQSVDDLCGFAEWDPLLSELKEMGFNDKELNKKLLIKNGGSIKRTVLDLITGKSAD